MSKQAVYRPKELLRKFKAEHGKQYVYRGEPRVYPRPLWPSKYRNGFVSESPLRIDPEDTIRGIGGNFYFRLDFQRDPYLGKDKKAYDQLMQREDLRSLFMGHIRNALGYALSEAMFQQAGWTSEGIDVTDEPEVALSFALSTWDKNGQHQRPRAEPAVLFRWIMPQKQWSFDHLRRFNYYSCPTVIPTREICRLLRPGSKAEFQSSLLEYQQAIQWDCRHFDLDAVQGARPFEILRLPRTWATSSRVELQCAALVLPDCARPDAQMRFAQRRDLGMMSPQTINEQGERLSVRDCLQHGNFVEDVASRPGAETYLVDLSDQSCIDEVSSIFTKEISPKFDVAFDILANWIKPFYRPVTAHGTMPLETGMSIDPENLWEALGTPEPERRFSN